MHDLRDVGGTKGGLGRFLAGLSLLLVGCYLFLSRVIVHGGYWNMFRSEGTSFGMTLLFLMLGVGLLFYDAASTAGRLLTVGSFLVLVTGIIVNLEVHFQATSLWSTLLMLGMLAAGIGLVVRSLRSVG